MNGKLSAAISTSLVTEDSSSLLKIESILILDTVFSSCEMNYSIFYSFILRNTFVMLENEVCL